MASPVDLDQLKAQLRIDGTGEDTHLQQLLDAATGATARYLDRPLDDEALGELDQAVIAQAIVVWVTALYEDREGERDTPTAVAALLRPLRSWAR